MQNARAYQKDNLVACYKTPCTLRKGQCPSKRYKRKPNDLATEVLAEHTSEVVLG